MLYSILIIEPTEQLPPEKQFGGLTEWEHDYLPTSALCAGSWNEMQKKAVNRATKHWYETRDYPPLQRHYEEAVFLLLGDKYYIQLELTNSDEAAPSQLMDDIDDLWMNYLEPTCKALGLTITYYHIITLGDNRLLGKSDSLKDF